ncbi:hypothetical protein F2Q70_00039942 [Brassica cretica]|uniref:Uncharacterized protein n=1 Tax=Brassica cretica TaxID=69181 RepID=A0A8S9K7G2_BRACR|nr:hypothetical protein F2Q70_00039942 [Brassica cretica]
MSMNKNTSAAGKSSNLPPLSLVDYSDDEDQTTPQGSQTSQSRSDVFGTATEHFNTESDADSDPAEPHIEDEQMTKKQDHAEPIIEPTQVETPAENESEKGDESEKTESEDVEEVDVEDQKLCQPLDHSTNSCQTGKVVVSAKVFEYMSPVCVIECHSGTVKIRSDQVISGQYVSTS